MITIHNYAKSLAKLIRKNGQYSTSGIYISAVNSFLRFAEDHEMTFDKVTPEMIKQFEESLLKKGRHQNTLSTYMRMLSSIFNQAEEQGIKLSYPTEKLFRFVFTGYAPTVKRAVSPALLHRLSILNLTKHPHLRFSRDMFLLSFYLRGIPYVDLAYLRKSNVKDNTIYYQRHKTGQQLNVEIEKPAAELIKMYKANDKTPYLLPILTETAENAHRQYKSALRLYNLHLHQLSDLLQLSTPLTSYVARHSWATAAKREGIAISMISESLGHSSEKVTQTYLATFDNNEMSKANRKVIDAVLGKKKKD